MLLQQKIYISTASAGQTGKAPSLYARRFFVLPYPFSDTEGGIRKRSCGYKGGCGPAKRRGLWKRKGCKAMRLAKKPPLFKACAAPFAKTARFAQAAAPAFAFCPSGSPTAAPPVLPQNVCPPSCETFVRRLASWRTCVRRAGRVHIGARENRQIRRFVCRWAAQEAFRPPKKEVCKKPPVRSRPSGGGTAIRRGMPSDGECRPKTLFAGPTRQAAGEFCRNTQVKREVIHLSTRLSTMPAFYAVKKPQKRAGKKGRAKGNSREKERLYKKRLYK